ncbi:MAG TPA: DUF115 domain-containing protein [Planctomycetes bacterium]|nr:DUF115 domain-containing protein [Planctomycetota bacterium]
MIPENETILERRWPSLLEWLRGAEEGDLLLVERVPAPALHLDGVQLASAYAPNAEAKLQASLIPEGTTHATVYGLGQGALPRELLRRRELEKLTVVLLSRAAASAAVRYVELFDWLDDPRVELEIADEDTKLATPFTMTPAALRLADPRVWGLRDRIQSELAMPFVRRHLASRGACRELDRDRTDNLAALDRDVAELFGSRPGDAIRVCASGPSLAEGFEELRSCSEPIVAVDTALAPLLQAGITPDWVVSVDGNDESIREVLAPASIGTGDAPSIPLVYFPAVGSEILERWKGDRYVAQGTTQEEGTPGGSRPGELFCAGSVLHVAVDLAVRMGAKRVLLHGADFATPEGESHVEGMVWKKDVSSTETGATPRVMNGHDRPVPSLPNLLAYLRDFEDYIARRPGVEFINRSRSGARIRGACYEEAQHAA